MFVVPDKRKIYIYFFLEINTFIQQGCNKLIKSDSEDIYNVRILKYIESWKYFNIDNNKKSFLSSKSAY